MTAPVKLGSAWADTKNNMVTVRAIVIKRNETWIQYGYYGTDTTYECLVAAFLERFKQRII